MQEKGLLGSGSHTSSSRDARGPAEIPCEIGKEILTGIPKEPENRSVPVELTPEPGPGVGPVPISRSGVEAEFGRGFVDRQAEKKPDLDQPGTTRLGRGQANQGVI